MFRPMLTAIASRPPNMFQIVLPCEMNTQARPYFTLISSSAGAIACRKAAPCTWVSPARPNTPATVVAPWLSAKAATPPSTVLITSAAQYAWPACSGLRAPRNWPATLLAPGAIIMNTSTHTMKMGITVPTPAATWFEIRLRKYESEKKIENVSTSSMKTGMTIAHTGGSCCCDGAADIGDAGLLMGGSFLRDWGGGDGGGLLAQRVADARADAGLVELLEQRDAVAGQVAPVPALVEFLAHAVVVAGEVPRHAEQTRLALHVDALAAHVAIQQRAQGGIGQVRLARLHQQAGRTQLAQDVAGACAELRGERVGAQGRTGCHQAALRRRPLLVHAQQRQPRHLDIGSELAQLALDLAEFAHADRIAHHRCHRHMGAHAVIEADLAHVQRPGIQAAEARERRFRIAQQEDAVARHEDVVEEQHGVLLVVAAGEGMRERVLRPRQRLAAHDAQAGRLHRQRAPEHEFG